MPPASHSACERSDHNRDGTKPWAGSHIDPPRTQFETPLISSLEPNQAWYFATPCFPRSAGCAPALLDPRPLEYFPLGKPVAIGQFQIRPFVNYPSEMNR